MKFYIILLINLCFFSILNAENNFDKCKINDNATNYKEKASYAFEKAHNLITESQNKPFSSEYKQGLECILLAVSLEPTRTRYLEFLGDVYNILGLNNVPMASSIALDAYDEAIKLDNSLNEVRIKAAIIEVNAQLYEDSLEHFEGAIKNSSMYLLPNVLDWMNTAYILIPQTSRGIQFYTNMLKKYPEADILNIYKAILLKTQHNKKEAGKVLLQVIANSKSNQQTIDMAYKLLSELK